MKSKLLLFTLTMMTCLIYSDIKSQSSIGTETSDLLSAIIKVKAANALSVILLKRGFKKNANEFFLKPSIDNDIAKEFTVAIKADSVQKNSSMGLRFSIKINNKSDHQVKIINPIDLFNLNLLNEKGINVLFPHVSKIFIHTVADERTSFEAFNVLNVMVNGKPGNDKLEQVKQIEIPAKGSYEIFFSITKSLRPEAVKPYKIDETMVLSSGKYSLSTFISIKKGDKHGIFNTSIPVKYGM